jgi:hypothetical protein
MDKQWGTFTLVVVADLNSLPPDNSFKLGLARLQRLLSKILPVQLQQVEGIQKDLLVVTLAVELGEIGAGPLEPLARESCPGSSVPNCNHSEGDEKSQSDKEHHGNEGGIFAR